MSEATSETEYWHVQLLSGEVRYWSLDELDEAFQRGDVDGKTFVLGQGSTKWESLSDLLGLDDEAAGAAAHAPVSVAPVSGPVSAPISEVAPVMSIRPVVSDIDLDDDMVEFQPKNSKKKVGMALGGGAALLLALAAFAGSASGSSDAKVAAAAPPPPPPAPVVDPVPAPPPQAAMSDDVKRALMDADKARAAKSAEKARARAASAASHVSAASYRTPKSGQVFHKGGEKYDPLNSAL